MSVFDPNTRISTVTLVGCGGTGGQIARTLARILYDMRERRLATPTVRLVDPDTVEPKNVGRQLYTVADVGQNKSEVLACRFNRALGLDIEWVPEPLDASAHVERYGGNLVIDAEIIIWRGGRLRRFRVLRCPAVISPLADRSQSVTRLTSRECGGIWRTIPKRCAICRRSRCCSPRC